VSDYAFGVGATEIPSAAVDAALRDPRGWVILEPGSEKDGAVRGNEAVFANGVLIAVVARRRAGDPQVLEEVAAALEQTGSPSPDSRDETVRVGDFVTAHEAAKALGVKPQSVRKWSERPWLDFPQPRLRLGRRGAIHVYSLREIEAWHRNRHRHKRGRASS
jgi:hypothetical protein